MRYCIYLNTSHGYYQFQPCWSAATDYNCFINFGATPLDDIDTIDSWLLFKGSYHNQGAASIRINTAYTICLVQSDFSSLQLESKVI